LGLSIYFWSSGKQVLLLKSKIMVSSLKNQRVGLRQATLT
jgi:hypothetical protein